MRLIYKINRLLKFPGLPIAKLTNDAGTEEYILRNDGWVVIRSTDKNDNSIDMLPITMVNPKLVERFGDQLTR